IRVTSTRVGDMPVAATVGGTAISGSPQSDTFSMATDVSVTKIADEAEVVAGETTSFTITRRNHSRETIPAGERILLEERPGVGVEITGFSVISGQASVTSTGNSATVTTTGNLPTNGQVVIRVLATVSPSATGSIGNGISIRGPETNPGDTPDDEDDIPPVPVIQRTDLSIVKTVSNFQPYVGDNIEFTLTVTNNGPSDATGVLVTDELPDGYTYVSSSASVGTYNPATDLWTIGDMEDGETATLTIVATVLATGDYINYASVTGDEDDPDLTNNEDTPDTPVVPVDESE